MTLYKNVFAEVPADGTTVWIVRFPYFDTPVQADWDEASALFTWTDSAANTHTIGVNDVWKWRPL